MLLTGASGRGLSAPRPPLPTPNAQAATAHLPSSSPSSERSGPWHGYAERRDGDLSGAGFVRAAGRSDAAGAADLRGPPQDGPTTARSRRRGQSVARPARGRSWHLGSRGHLQGGTRRDGSHGRAASGPESRGAGLNTRTTFLFQLHDHRSASGFAEVLVFRTEQYLVTVLRHHEISRRGGRHDSCLPW